MLFVYKCQLQKFHEKSCNVKCIAFCIQKRNGNCLALFFNVQDFLAFIVYETCALSFHDCSHRNFHTYTQTIFLRNLFYTKRKKSILFTNRIPRALFSNKQFFALLQKVNISIATKLGMNLINTCTIFLGEKWCTTQFND